MPTSAKPIAFVKLACGCKVGAMAHVNSNTKGVIPPAHLRQLTAFHKAIHAIAARHHARELRRPKGDGKIEGVIGGRYTAKQTISFYSRELQGHKRPRIDNSKPTMNGEYLTAGMNYALGRYLSPHPAGSAGSGIPKSKFIGTHHRGQPRLGARLSRKAA